MPVNVNKELPAIQALERENIFVMDKSRAMTQDIRPLEILVVNLMPKKSETEVQLLRLLGNTPLQINVYFLHMGTHQAKNTKKEHLTKFYHTFAEVKDHYFDGLIVTGAPVEKMPFEEVDYWEELTEIFDWKKTHVFSTLNICWGAQAALYYDHGIDKVRLPEKLTGIFQQTVLRPLEPLFRGFDDRFWAPHSRYTGLDESQIDDDPALEVWATSAKAGSSVIADMHSRAFYLLGHLEYDRNTLKEEYLRDLGKGIAPLVPENYFPHDDPEQIPAVRWHMAASLLFSNWINYTVYQDTPYDLSTLGTVAAEE